MLQQDPGAAPGPLSSNSQPSEAQGAGSSFDLARGPQLDSPPPLAVLADRASDPQALESLRTMLLGARLGASLNNVGVSFRVRVPRADQVSVCIFASGEDTSPRLEVPLINLGDGSWGAHIAGLGAGTLYGYRAQGEYDPARELYFKSDAILFDPYARALTPDLKEWSLQRSPRPLGVVVPDEIFRGEVSPRPRHGPRDMRVVELHVKEATAAHPGVPEKLRGTFAGLAHPAFMAHLKEVLCCTSVKIMPVAYGMSERFLREKGLVNHWNYNPLSFFGLHPSYAAASDPLGQIVEFRQMVDEFHRNGIEVLLDVVYNHTGEGRLDPEQQSSANGPTVSLRGLDGRYYLHADGRGVNFTGCGNTVNCEYPDAQQLVRDSLRYLFDQLLVDGVRFDEAPVLGRRGGQYGHYFDKDHWGRVVGYNGNHSHNPLPPVGTKFIVEPWDCGPERDRHHLGNFPAGVLEWNIEYCQTVRRFWRGDAGVLRHFATQLYGGENIFGRDGRSPRDNILYVSVHDGFTLWDTWSYSQKHNEANGEQNRDGTDQNYSWNCGAEGPTGDRAINNLRLQMCYNSLATLFLSSGIPMLQLGDELGRSKQGNNNSYCQDNSLSHIDWSACERSERLKRFVQQLAQFRKENPGLCRDGYEGNIRLGEDHTWYRPDGQRMTREDWFDPERKVVGTFLSPHTVKDLGKGDRRYDTLLILFNAHDKEVRFRLPNLPQEEGRSYQQVFNTANLKDPFEVAEAIECESSFNLAPRSMVLLRLRESVNLEEAVDPLSEC